MLKLLIADNSDAFTDALCEQLDGEFEIYCCNDGREVISLLHNISPDLLLLDMMLPGCDGISILESVFAMEERPVVLAVSRIFGFYVRESLERLGVSYAMQKPCDVNIICNRLRDLANYPKSKLVPEAEEEETVRSMLWALGIAGNRLGYHGLVEAIRLIARNPKQQYTKELYPAVGLIVGCTWNQVERDIRKTIEEAWKVRDPVVWDEFFPQHRGMNTKPSNSLFIAALGQLLRRRLADHLNESNTL